MKLSVAVVVLFAAITVAYGKVEKDVTSLQIGVKVKEQHSLSESCCKSGLGP